jgi:hypothetical protein
VVFFLATDPSSRTIGISSFLLNLLYHEIFIWRKTQIRFI